jgi:hypothetical protein
MDQVVTAAEQRLEGHVNKAVIQEFVEQDVMAQQQVEEAQAKLNAFEEELVRSK